MKNSKTLLLFYVMYNLIACNSTRLPALPLAQNVALEKFMGDWYVIAVIPTFIEKEAYNSVESYKLDQDGSIDTTFTFNKGSLDGPQKKYNPRGYVVEGTQNAVWRMRFFWPFKSDYRISYLNEDYSVTIVAREKRDYVWLMARTPQISSELYDKMLNLISTFGYDINKIRKIPHSTN